MKFIYFLKNLFTGFRPYNFTNKHLQEKPQQQNSLSLEKKLSKRKRFMSKHRYTHTTKKWDIGNTYKK